MVEGSEEIHIQLLRVVNNMSLEIASLRAEHREMRTELLDHMRHEESEDKEIADKIQGLSDKIDSFSPIKTAFILNPDGTRDYDGHNRDHRRRIDDDDETKKRWDKIKDWSGEVIVKGMVYGIIGLALFTGKEWFAQQVNSVVSTSHIEVKR